MTLRPVGKLPSSVYWRRRLIVLVPLLFLVGLTAYVACSPGGTKPPSAAGSPVASTSSASTTPSTTPSDTPTPTTSSSAPTGVACVATSLQVSAVTSAPSYVVGSEPVLSLQVVNTGMADCTQDLADPQVVLTLFNGAARVWGSHDCKVQPGTSVQTLVPNQPVKLSITWTGLSSQPSCAGQRTQVGAGTYTLHAQLGSIDGATAQFTLT